MSLNIKQFDFLVGAYKPSTKWEFTPVIQLGDLQTNTTRRMDKFL